VKTILYIVLCLSLIGCIPTVPLIDNEQSKFITPITEYGPVNSSGTQVSGIDNHGTMNVYINSEADKDSKEIIDKPELIQDDIDIAIKSDEGLRLKPYTDMNRKLHIGYGRNLTDKGISKEESDFLYKNDKSEVIRDLKSIFPEWDSFPRSIQKALANMRFQLGHKGFCEFENLIYHIKSGEWILAAAEMRDSKWYIQTPKRTERLAQEIENTK
jgi:lysozyme